MSRCSSGNPDPPCRVIYATAVASLLKVGLALGFGAEDGRRFAAYQALLELVCWTLLAAQGFITWGWGDIHDIQSSTRKIPLTVTLIQLPLSAS
ncbi:hypothetical protein V8F20_011043 [Naviculisporaceae sp. PSN 640]